MASDLAHMMDEVYAFSEEVRNGQYLSETARRDWAKRYLLSAHREISDMLDAMPGWKEHRRELSSDRADVDALIEEASDVINYIFATLGLWGVGSNQFAQVWQQKMNVLWQRRDQEVDNPIQPGQPIAMIDLDGVVADFRKGLLGWCGAEAGYEWARVEDPCRNLQIDLDLGVEPALYRAAKLEFERMGGYGMLPAFPGAQELLSAVIERGWRPVFVTSRPEIPARTYRDSLSWLQRTFPVLSEVHFTLVFTRRKAEWLRDCGGAVQVCIEDDPAQVSRLAAQGYPVLVPSHRYNAEIFTNGLVQRTPLHHMAEEVRWLRPLGSESLLSEGAEHEQAR